MDAIEKALKKLSERERRWVKDVLARIPAGKARGLDIKKLKGRDDIFRVRKGDIRIIYRKSGDAIYLLSIGRKKEQTYGF